MHTPSPTHFPVSASAKYFVRMREPREYPAAKRGASGKRRCISSTAKCASSVKAAEYVLEVVSGSPASPRCQDCSKKVERDCNTPRCMSTPACTSAFDRTVITIEMIEIHIRIGDFNAG